MTVETVPLRLTIVLFTLPLRVRRCVTLLPSTCLKGMLVTDDIAVVTLLVAIAVPPVSAPLCYVLNLSLTLFRRRRLLLWNPVVSLKLLVRTVPLPPACIVTTLVLSLPSLVGCVAARTCTSVLVLLTVLTVPLGRPCLGRQCVAT